MARTDDTTPARFDALHELLTRAAELNLSVTMNVHGVPTEVLFDWLQLGLLDNIEPGAGEGAAQNPPTGVIESGSWGKGKAEASCFMEDEHERRRRIEREEDLAVQRLADQLAGEDEGVTA